MKEISMSELRRASADELRDGGCLRLMADGEEVGIIVIGAISLMRDKILALISQIEAMRGK